MPHSESHYIFLSEGGRRSEFSGFPVGERNKSRDPWQCTRIWENPTVQINKIRMIFFFLPSRFANRSGAMSNRIAASSHRRRNSGTRARTHSNTSRRTISACPVSKEHFSAIKRLRRRSARCPPNRPGLAAIFFMD